MRLRIVFVKGIFGGNFSNLYMYFSLIGMAAFPIGSIGTVRRFLKYLPTPSGQYAKCSCT